MVHIKGTVSKKVCHDHRDAFHPKVRENVVFHKLNLTTVFRKVAFPISSYLISEKFGKKKFQGKCHYYNFFIFSYKIIKFAIEFHKDYLSFLS